MTSESNKNDSGYCSIVTMRFTGARSVTDGASGNAAVGCPVTGVRHAIVVIVDAVDNRSIENVRTEKYTLMTGVHVNMCLVAWHQHHLANLLSFGYVVARCHLDIRCIVVRTTTTA